MLRINLISSPRNISTALMYSFAQRSDTKVVDEPFYGYYLSIRAVDHPGRDEVIRSMETDPTRIVQSLLENDEKPVLFIKNMAHHLIEIEDRFFNSATNLFLIRNPAQLIASFSRIVPNPTMNDIAIRKQYELFRRLSRIGRTPVVVDSGELLKNPKRVITSMCEALGIRFEEAMLSWSPGPRPEDGVWAKYWYQSVHKSTSFAQQPTSNQLLAAHLEPLHQEALPLYSEMYAVCIKA